MDILVMTQSQFAAFLLVLVRCTGIFGFAPVLSNPRMPVQVKYGLSFFSAVLLYPVVAAGGYAPPDSLWLYAGDVIGELFVGLCIGFVSGLMMTCLQLAGSMIDMQIGFSMANMVDPLSNIQTTVIGQFQILLATLLFIAVRGDHMVIRAVSDSYSVAPLGGVCFQGEAVSLIFALLSETFVIAFKISAPIIAVLFLATVGLGIVARTVPQMNVLMVGFPVKIAIGLVATVAMIPFMVAVLVRMYERYPVGVGALLRFLTG